MPKTRWEPLQLDKIPRAPNYCDVIDSIKAGQCINIFWDKKHALVWSKCTNTALDGKFFCAQCSEAASIPRWMSRVVDAIRIGQCVVPDCRGSVCLNDRFFCRAHHVCW